MKILKALVLVILVFFSTSCAEHHVIKSDAPCFVPYKDYLYKTCKDFNFSVDSKAYKIKKGFVTDFSSIPKIFWSIYSPHQSNTVRSAIIHDYLYTKRARVDRRYADSVFYNSLLKDKVSNSQSYLFWASVRIFGKSSYHVK